MHSISETVQSTVQTQENKGAPGPPRVDEVEQALARLEGALEALLVFLKAYDGSRHPARFEALRWQMPRLIGLSGTLKALSAGLEPGEPSAPPRR